MKVWLDPVILNTKYWPNEWQELHDSWKEAHKLWKHADDILIGHDEDLYRIDSITTLKRALFHRLDYISGRFNLKELPLRNKPSKTLQQLAYLQLTRDTMLKKLIELRNLLEHENASPPDTDACSQYVDFVWYFLRSTDYLVHRYTDGFRLEDANQARDIEFTVQPDDKWKITMKGIFPLVLLSRQERDKWIELEFATVGQLSYLELDDSHSQPSEEDVVAEYERLTKIERNINLYANVMGPDDKLLELIKMYFSLYVLW